MKARLTTLLVTLWLVLLSVNSIAAQAPASQGGVGIQTALGTSFVYQGFLTNNGQPANGSFDFGFTLYDAPSGGNQIGSPSSAASQAVSNGLFTTMIDAGPGAFNGEIRFLEIRVRPTGGGNFVTLSPRVELAAVPYAQYAQFSNSTGGLQGRPVSGAAPAPNQVLQWDGSQWVPTTAAAATYTAGNGLVLNGNEFSVAVPLNLTGSSGTIFSATNTGTGRAGSFLNQQAGAAASRGENTATNGLGVYGVANNGGGAVAVEGDSTSGTGVLGFSSNLWGMLGITRADNAAAVLGEQGPQGNYSYYPAALAGSSNSPDGTGVSGYANTGSSAYGVWGVSSNGFAGFFSGKVAVTGAFSAASKNFKIDDPIDPTNKYLYHTSVESPDMKNIYDGVVTLDANGAAVIELPAYFQALNRDFRYQLTCIGGFAPVYIEKEIQDNRFSIAGGKPGMKVSWQVTGIRHDPWAEQNRSPVEENKPPSERGKYMHPAAYGQPETLGVDYARKQQMVMEQVTRQEGH